MADINLKIYSDFRDAEKDFEALKAESEIARKQIDKFNASFDPKHIDEFTAKNKLATAGIKATKGPLAASKAEVKALEKEMLKLTKQGLDPASLAFKKLDSQLVDARQEMDRLTDATKKNAAGFKKSSQAATTMLNMLKGFAIGFSVTEVLRVGNEAIKSWQVQEAAVKNVEAGLASTQNAVGLTSKEFQDMASAVQEVGIFGDEAILQNVTAQFLTFGNIGKENFDRIQKAALDVTAKLKGVNATNEDLRATAIMMGKAMDDPVRGMNAMRRVGIAFTTEEELIIKSMVKANDTIGAQKVMLEAIERQYGGTNEALRKTNAGMEIAAKNDLGDAMEILGKNLEPVKTGLINVTLALADYIKMRDSMGDSLGDVFLENIPIIGEATRAINRFSEANKEHVVTVEELQAKQKTLTDEYVKLNGVSDEGSKARQKNIIKEITLIQSQLKYARGFTQEEQKQLSIEEQRLRVRSSGTYGKKPKRIRIPTGAPTPADVAAYYESIGDMRKSDLAKIDEQQAAEIENARLMYTQKKIDREEYQQALIDIDANAAEAKLKVEENLRKDVEKEQKKLTAARVQFGGQMLNYSADIVNNLQTIFANAGAKSHALAVAMKGLAVAQATVQTYLAGVRTLADPFFIGRPWERGIAKAAIIASGLTSVAAIASTPIPSAQTGIEYTVPETRGTRNDGAAVMAQGGETVSVTPRGEENASTTTNIYLDKKVLFSTINRGIKTGEINLSNKNLQKGVFQ